MVTKIRFLFSVPRTSYRQKRDFIQCALHGCIAKEPVDHLQGSLGRSGTETPKSQKKVSLGLQPRDPPRVWKKSRKSLSGPFRDFFQTLQTFSRLLPDSRGVPELQAPGRHFSHFFGVSGPEGPRDPCKWSTRSQCIAKCKQHGRHHSSPKCKLQGLDQKYPQYCWEFHDRL